MKDWFIGLGCFLQSLIGIVVVSLFAVGWLLFFGPLFNNITYNLFNSSPMHVQAISQRFADDCQQLSTTKMQTSRLAIENDIYSLASTVDLNKIQMPDTVRICVNQAIQDVTGGN